MPDQATPDATVQAEPQAVADAVNAAIAGEPAAEPTETTEAVETPAEAPSEPAAEPDETQAVSESGDLAPALRTAALAMRWTPEEIDQHVKAVGADRAARDFEVYRKRILDDVDGLSTAQPPAAQAATPAQPPAVPSPKRAALVERFKDIDEQAATELDSYLADMERQTQESRDTQARISAAARAQQVQQFVSGVIDRMAGQGYAEFYGEPGKPRTRMQAERHREVAQVADALAAKYAALGRPISDEDAVVRAHMSVTRDLSPKAAAVAEVRAQVIKRAGQKTIPPKTAGGTTGGTWQERAAAAIDAAPRK